MFAARGFTRPIRVRELLRSRVGTLRACKRNEEGEPATPKGANRVRVVCQRCGKSVRILLKVNAKYERVCRACRLELSKKPTTPHPPQRSPSPTLQALSASRLQTETKHREGPAEPPEPPTPRVEWDPKMAID